MTKDQELKGPETTAAPSASEELGKRIDLTTENKRLAFLIEKEVAGLDWDTLDRFGAAPRLAWASQHLLSAGGKRVRPLLIALLSRALDVPFEKLHRCAVAAELVHTATLLHDDVLDGALTRRHRATAHLKYGAHTAILAGDSLLAKAIADIAELNDPEILKRLAQTVRELVEGESLQADLEGRVHGDVSAVLEVARRKTASLFAWCGWVTGHRAGKFSDALFLFGNHLGISFQILDDLLDWEGKDTGKPPYLDLFEKKLNVVGAKLVSLSPEARKQVQDFFAQEPDLEKAAALGLTLKSLDAYGEASAWARKEAQEQSELALGYLKELPESVWRELTLYLTHSLLERMK
jgi:geranylgeranyl pyrophosphate synthase